MPLKIKVKGVEKLIYVPGTFNPKNFPKEKSSKIQPNWKIQSQKIKAGRISEPVRITDESSFSETPLNIFPIYTAENSVESDALKALYEIADGVEKLTAENYSGYINLLQKGYDILYNPDYFKYVHILSAVRYCLQISSEKKRILGKYYYYMLPDKNYHLTVFEGYDIYTEYNLMKEDISEYLEK